MRLDPATKKVETVGIPDIGPRRGEGEARLYEAGEYSVHAGRGCGGRWVAVPDGDLPATPCRVFSEADGHQMTTPARSVSEGRPSLTLRAGCSEGYPP